MAWRHVPLAINTLAAWMLTTYELPVKSHSTVSLNNQPLFQRLALEDNYWNELRSVNADSVWEAAATGALPSSSFPMTYFWSSSRSFAELRQDASATPCTFFFYFFEVVSQVWVRLCIKVLKTKPAWYQSGSEACEKPTGTQVRHSSFSLRLGDFHQRIESLQGQGQRCNLVYSHGYTQIYFCPSAVCIHI